MKVFAVFFLILQLFILPACSDGVAAGQIQSLDELGQLGDIVDVEKLELGEKQDKEAVIYRIRYRSDDCQVMGYIAAPADYLKKKYPVLIYNRGGNQEFGKLNDTMLAAFAAPAFGHVSSGYIVMGSQYRGVDGGTGKEQFGGDEVHDVLKLVDISESFAFAQRGGVYMAGHSRGGMMTFLCCRQDSRIKAAAVFSGVSDAVDFYNDEPRMKQVFTSLVGGSPEELPEEYEKRSAVKWADEINVPLLLVHGGAADWRVKTQQSQDMMEQLKKSGKVCKLVLYEEADHSLEGTGYLQDMCDWFEEHSFFK